MTFPGGGVYPWVWLPWLCAALALTWLVRPLTTPDRPTRILDALLVASGLAILIQLIPLPIAVMRWLDVHAIALRTSVWLADPAPDGAIPISIVPADTLSAFAVFAGAVVSFWTCRHVCERGGAGRIVRATALIGLAASVAAIVQRARSQELLYGIWRPLDAGARPYGPFVNRNHFATWVVLACPLVYGYVLARAPAGRRARSLSQRFVNAMMQLGSMRVWLVTAVCLMTLAVMISTSRSGLIALIAAFGTSAWLSVRRSGGSVLRWTLLQAALLVIVAVSFANFESLSARLDETRAVEGAGRGRMAVWADAKRVVRDFPVTGTGAGTFGTAVGAYQTAAPGYAIGHAHNHYLQLAAEGGALVALPAVLAAAAFLTLFVRRMTEDASSNYLMRAGAAAGMVGVLLQSVWETGLRMPANAMLFAILAAIATYPSNAVRRAAD